MACNPLSKIIVRAASVGTSAAAVYCTSTAPFMVYGLTNMTPNGTGYGIEVQSTGAEIGSNAPTFAIGAGAGDTIRFSFQPGTNAFLTLQTECGATASVEEKVVNS
jgi:hypothetical protein